MIYYGMVPYLLVTEEAKILHHGLLMAQTNADTFNRKSKNMTSHSESATDRFDEITIK